MNHLKYQYGVRNVQLYFNFLTNPCILYIAQHFGLILQLIFGQFVNLINHNTIVL